MNFRDQTCIYCQSRPAVRQGDHIFARGFFLEARRQNLPKVPCCEQCGGEKAKLEHYLTTVLPFGGRHGDASQNLAELVPGRLAKNKRLHRELAEQGSRAWSVEASGLLVRTTTVPIDGAKVEQLFSFIVKGLMWHHWRVDLGADAFVEVHLAEGAVEQAFANLSKLRAKALVTGNIDDGTFTYAGAQGTDNDVVSTWDFTVYGGMRISGAQPGAEISRIRAMTGPRRVAENAERRAKATGRIILGLKLDG